MKAQVKIISKRIFPSFLVAVMLAACNGSISSPGTSPTDVMETAVAKAWTEHANTQAAMPTNTPLPPSPSQFGSPTAIPGPYTIIPPNPDQQVYTDPDGWYAVNFPADMKPTDQPNSFSRPESFFETGYLPEMGYLSKAQIVCAWLANIEFKPEESNIGWFYEGYGYDFPPRPKCSVSTKTNEWHAVTYQIFENPAADPEHRFIYIKTGIRYPGANPVGAGLSWLKPVYESKFESRLKPLSPEETALWENTAPILLNASVTEYILPPEAQVGPGEEMLLNYVPDEVQPDWEALRKKFSTSQAEPTVEEQLKPLGYELKSITIETNQGPFTRQQLYRDGRILFDYVYKVSDVYTFPTASPPITAFVVYTADAPYSGYFNGFLIENDIVHEWNYDIQDPPFAPVLYLDELLWLKATRDGHIQVMKTNRDIIYTFAVYTEPVYSGTRFEAWNGHWILAARDFLIQDGEILNETLGFQEIFSWTLVENKPVYLFRKGPRIGFSYDGNILPLEYQEVAHHLCCGFSSNNPDIFDDTAYFFGKRDGVWYYVKVKFK